MFSAGLTRRSKSAHNNFMLYFIYIMTNKPKGTLYVGVTNNLFRRVYEHKQELCEGFTKKYNIKHLVYYESYASIYTARQRERNIKHWSREWKIELIEKMNPEWMDLYDRL